MRKRRVVILGATGSIGESARKVARDIPERMEIVGMSAHSNADKLQAAAHAFPAAKLAMSSGPDGVDRLVELATLPEADLVLIAIVGTAGLRPALAAIEAGKDIAVASKEILVMAGEAVMNAARQKGVKVLPVDSEHNAIFQCLEGRDSKEVRRLILTASGGPFRKWPVASLAGVTPEQALKHPTWNMGAKITVDSATLFNKGLEMIEARWLFDVEMARVEVIVHPQSIVHSMVEFIDSSVLAQLSTTDMCFPIQYAVTMAGPGEQYAAAPRFRQTRETGIRSAAAGRFSGGQSGPLGRRNRRHAPGSAERRQRGRSGGISAQELQLPRHLANRRAGHAAAPFRCRSRARCYLGGGCLGARTRQRASFLATERRNTRRMNASLPDVSLLYSVVYFPL